MSRAVVLFKEFLFNESLLHFIFLIIDRLKSGIFSTEFNVSNFDGPCKMHPCVQFMKKYKRWQTLCEKINSFISKLHQPDFVDKKFQANFTPCIYLCVGTRVQHLLQVLW